MTNRHALVFQIFFSMIFLTVSYFMTGLPVESYRFFTFCVIGIIVSLTAEGMGLFIGSVFNVTVRFANMYLLTYILYNCYVVVATYILVDK